MIRRCAVAMFTLTLSYSSPIWSGLTCVASACGEHGHCGHGRGGGGRGGGGAGPQGYGCSGLGGAEGPHGAVGAFGGLANPSRPTRPPTHRRNNVTRMETSRGEMR